MIHPQATGVIGLDELRPEAACSTCSLAYLRAAGWFVPID